MSAKNTIQIYEYDELKIGSNYGEEKIFFKESHFKALARYITLNKSCHYYTLLYNRVKFCNYVGVIKVGDLTIEVLPKTDRSSNENSKTTWQKVLIEMLAISIQVEAKTTTYADINIRQHTVLETYLHLFLNETETLIHQGLVKKYHAVENNQTALRGKLQIHKHIIKNIVHAERFYVSHQVYDCNNVFNSILLQAIQCIQSISASTSVNRRCQSLLLNFPECTAIKISEKLFQDMQYDRKTERYKTVISLARIILMNYHPDAKGGKNNILAIMFDMNLLWESYIYYVLKRSDQTLDVKRHKKKLFWRKKDNDTQRIRLIPDIVVTSNENKSIVLDTKWKYEKDVSVQDLRQMYVYGKYFDAEKNYLVYPFNAINNENIKVDSGNFYFTDEVKTDENNSCGLVFVDLLKDGKLNKEVGKEIKEKLD